MVRFLCNLKFCLIDLPRRGLTARAELLDVYSIATCLLDRAAAPALDVCAGRQLRPEQSGLYTVRR